MLKENMTKSFAFLQGSFNFCIDKTDLSDKIVSATEQSVEQTARAVGHITKRKREYAAK